MIDRVGMALMFFFSSVGRVCLILSLFFLCHHAHAQVATSITGNNVTPTSSTQIVPPAPGGNIYGIQGGHTAGTNLFHSFGQFNVGAGDVAQFQTGAGPNISISNILGRVTGQQSPSQIFGTIDSATYYPSANLFMMNPYGFLFGPNATVNVGGMVAFTSADYLRLADGVRFNAAPDAVADALLSTAPVAAYGFLGSNPGAIIVQGSQLTVAPGQSISLVGSDITVQSGVLDDGTVQSAKLSAPGGQINLASVAGPGEISAADYMQTQGMAMGNISLSEGALIDVSANQAGTVKIRGGQLLMDQATISADTVDTSGAPVAIDINVTGNVSISAVDVPALTARTTGSGDAGEIQISSSSMDVTGSFLNDFVQSVIDTKTSGSGKGGNVNIATGDFQMTGDFLGITFIIDSGMIGTGGGRGGDINITAHSIEMQDANITSGFSVAQIFGEDTTGAAGNITVNSDSLLMSFSSFDTSALSFADSTGSIGRAGDITVTSGDIQIDSGFLAAQGFERGGAITVNADRLMLTGASDIITQTNLRPGGGITISANVVELTQASDLVSNTGGDGDAGSIHVTATDHLSLLEGFDNFRPTSITTTSVGTFGSGLGHGGDVFITTPRLEMTSGARINTTTQTSGRAGNVTIDAADSISISGEFLSTIQEPLFNLGNVRSSGIVTSTIGGKCSGPCGDAGTISITTGSLNLSSGAQINSGTSSTGRGGDITIQASDGISLSGTRSDGSPDGIFSRTIGTTPDAGAGGNIDLHAASFNVTNGAQISASTLGPGNAGSVTIEGTASPAQSILIDGSGSGIFTDTSGTGAGGNIFVNANSVTLQNGGTLSASTSGTEATATGGNITIEGDQVQLSGGAQVRSETFGAGAAGAIQVTATDAVTLTGTSADLQVPTRISASTFSGEPGAGAAGDIIVTARTLTAEGGASIVSGSFGEGAGGTIQVTATEAVRLTGGSVNPHTVSSPGGEIEVLGFASGLFADAGGTSLGAGAAGDIVVTTGTLTVEGGAGIDTSTIGHGAGGTIHVTAEAVTLAGTNFDGRIPSSLGALSLGDLAPPFFGIQGSGTGAAGDIVVTTGTLTVEGGALITSSSFGPGAGGKIQVTATEAVTLTGGNPASDVPDSNFVGGSASGIFAQTGGFRPGAGNGGTVTVTSPVLNMNGSAIATSTSSSGNAGTITLNVGTATLTNNATISSSSTGPATGAAGTVTIQGLASPAQSIVIDGVGSGIFTNTEGTGAGGQISVTANSVTLQNGAHISSSSTGPGATGNITINAGNQFAMTNATVTTEADQSSGGIITIKTNPEGTVQLTDSTISASVLNGEGGGGSVIIDPQSVILVNSQILANAVSGPGGNISITTNLLLPDANSTISASSQFGQEGTITIQSPNAPAGGKIVPLSQKPLIATSLLNQRCAALAPGNFSSFTVAGRDSLPAEPGSWLASPLALTSEFGGINAGSATSVDERAEDAPLLSLRQIAPPGFLTQHFAGDSSEGCTS